MFKKIFLAMIALCFIFMGSCSLIMGYFFFNPGTFNSGFQWMSDQAFKTHPFEEKQEYYIQGIQNIHVQSTQVPVRVEIHPGPSLQLVIEGQVQGDVKSLVHQVAETESLQIQLLNPESFSSFHMQINEQNYSSSDASEVKATLYVPSSFQNKLYIQTTEAPVEVFLPTNYYVQLQLRSESGEVRNEWEPTPLSDNSNLKVGTIEIQSEKGAISVLDQNL